MNESELLFTEVLNCSRVELYLNKQRRLRPEESGCLANALRRRLRFEPIQYILGKAEFMGLEFRLTTDVFIPRPETEVLVETALKVTRSEGQKIRTILDIGTGSGCIAISLAKFLKDVRIYATDISKQALETAKKNALLNDVDITFLQSNLFSNHRLRTIDCGLIICNPPYIPTAEMNGLEPEIGYEPRIALDGGRDGLDFYRRIIKTMPAYFKRGSFLVLEMGFNQCSAIKGLFNSVKSYQIIQIVKDYNSIDRVIVVRYG
jgi:release factor glutamine methyltransferase